MSASGPILVRSTRSRRSRHVRFAPITSGCRHRSESALRAKSDLVHRSKARTDCNGLRDHLRTWAAFGETLAWFKHSDASSKTSFAVLLLLRFRMTESSNKTDMLFKTER